MVPALAPRQIGDFVRGRLCKHHHGLLHPLHHLHHPSRRRRFSSRPFPPRMMIEGHDTYKWMEDKTQEVLDHLQKENRYCHEAMKSTHQLQIQLFNEMSEHIQHKAASIINIPESCGDGYIYYSRRERGKGSFPIYYRHLEQHPEDEEVVLDQNELPDHYQRKHLMDLKVSSDHRMAAFTLASPDAMSKGGSLYIRELKTGTWWTVDCWKEGIGSFEWGPILGNHHQQVLYYTTMDHFGRPSEVWNSLIKQDSQGLCLLPNRLLHVEKPEVFVTLTQSKDAQFVIVSANSKTSSEVYLLSGHAADGPPGQSSYKRVRLFRRRQANVQYFVDHGKDRFFIVTNYKNNALQSDVEGEYHVMTCPTTNTERWEPLEELEEERESFREEEPKSIDDIDLFQDCCVLYRRWGGISGFSVVSRRSVDQKGRHLSHRAALPPHVSCGKLQPGLNQAYHSEMVRFSVSSPIIPDITYDYNMTKRQLIEVYREQLCDRPAYDPLTRFRCERVMVTGDDPSIPMTLAYQQGDVGPGQGVHPILLYGYGAYGVSMDLSFRPELIPLLERGWIIAYAHCRGGGELGRDWHAQGRKEHKMNSLLDYVRCADWLVANKWTRPELLVGYGSSAGALMVAGAVNMRPDLFKAMILKVPFLDLVGNMTNPALPLTLHEYDEWGDPQQPGVLERLRTISPYDNLLSIAKGHPFPHTLILASLLDDRVGFWESAKYVARAREVAKGNCEILLRMDGSFGHAGPDSQVEILEEAAFESAFMISRLGLGGGNKSKGTPTTSRTGRQRRSGRRATCSNRFLNEVPPLAFWT